MAATDRIGLLPDDVLHCIISRLPMRDAVLTGSLSRRWRRLWELSVARFDFDPSLVSSAASHCRTSDFLSLVHRLFLLRRNPNPIKSLRLRFRLTFSESDHIDRWIASAAASGTDDLDIDLDVPSSYTFPFGVRFPSLKSLRLASCGLRLPIAFDGFDSLSIVTLENIADLNDGIVSELLSWCPSMERLRLGRCRGLLSLTIDGGCHQGLRLKHLRVGECRNLVGIVISAVDLASLEYYGQSVSFSFRKVYRVGEVRIDFRGSGYGDCIAHELEKLLGEVPEIGTVALWASLRNVHEDILPQDSVVFANLRQLSLDIPTRKDTGIHNMIIQILKSAPLLKKFQLDLLWYSGLDRTLTTTGETLRPGKFQHCHLNLVELTGFIGNTNEILLAKYILQTAVSLERMTVCPRKRCLLRDGKSETHPAHLLWSVEGRARVHEHLTPDVPPGAQLVIL
ncbi:putative F-box/FBD/LRR-repeat protein [Acorus calamus]|uniref:F-box/FBD/LRR-repeat protein n=1 Tax=Acorus calamus TaxID=4465 RepID=A0AAV9EHS8_ACOCL|nr:putative F-box/FBD/LRR-repeat protein [Acorus calamus]